MLDRIRDITGKHLDAQDYLDDFWPHFQRLNDVFWKFERFQTFREPDVPSWVAMMEGDWERSLRLAEEMRGEIEAELASARTGGFEMRRIRVVERPITAYLQWECQVLRLRAEAGERIRVIGADAIATEEADAPLPELVLLDSAVAYEVRFDSTDALSGARRVDDPETIAECRTDLSTLFDQGEDFLTFFEREIAPLPPPTPR